ncbi:MAG: hypothetical protein ABIQ12_11755 [Opitutaceae bacterium]
MGSVQAVKARSAGPPWGGLYDAAVVRRMVRRRNDDPLGETGFAVAIVREDVRIVE